MHQVTHPLMKNVAMEFGRGDLSDLVPSIPMTTYAGRYFYTAGRYKNPGTSALYCARLTRLDSTG